MNEAGTGANGDLLPGAWKFLEGIDADAPHETLPAWTPFKVAVTEGNADVYFQNSRYHVGVKRLRLQLFQIRPQVVYRLAIVNFDESARHDWRDFQRIKNELVGPEAEAFEIYPAESRLLDPSNCFFLWVLPRGDRIPVGSAGPRRVLGPDQAVAPQRALEVRAESKG